MNKQIVPLTGPLMAPVMALVLALPLAACAQGDGWEASGEVRAPAARVTGEPVSCVDTSRIRSTHVHDDYTIDFAMVDGTTYRNTLPRRCASLGFNQRFGYDLRGTTRLCGTDVIQVLDADGRQLSSCGLGQFVPVEITENR